MGLNNFNSETLLRKSFVNNSLQQQRKPTLNYNDSVQFFSKILNQERLVLYVKNKE